MPIQLNDLKTASDKLNETQRALTKLEAQRKSLLESIHSAMHNVGMLKWTV